MLGGLSNFKSVTLDKNYGRALLTSHDHPVSACGLARPLGSFDSNFTIERYVIVLYLFTIIK